MRGTGEDGREDPGARVVQAFERIAATRMAGLPICNPALRVEALGFRRWEDEWLGALITPWSIALMLLPGGGGAFRPLRLGQSQSWTFPSGEYEFLGNCEAGLGDYQSCSLYSPAFEFAAQEVARLTALAALEALFRAGAAVPADAACAPGAPQPVSRRGFLRTLLPGARP